MMTKSETFFGYSLPVVFMGAVIVIEWTKGPLHMPSLMVAVFAAFCLSLFVVFLYRGFIGLAQHEKTARCNPQGVIRALETDIEALQISVGGLKFDTELRKDAQTDENEECLATPIEAKIERLKALIEKVKAGGDLIEAEILLEVERRLETDASDSERVAKVLSETQSSNKGAE